MTTTNSGLPLRRVLLMGSSEITFDDYGTGPSLASILGEALAEGSPGFRWEVTSHIAYQRSNMPERCLPLAEGANPDLIVLWLGGSPFSEETVSFAVYHRSRRLYPYFDRFVNAMRGPRANSVEGGGGIGGMAYRSLRVLGKAIVGRRAFIDPQEAVVATIQTIDVLGSRWPLLCRLPYRDACRQPDQEAPSRQRVEDYNARVREACRERSVLCVSPSDEVEASGGQYRMAEDRLHADLPSRRLNAEITANRIINVISGRSLRA